MTDRDIDKGKGARDDTDAWLERLSGRAAGDHRGEPIARLRAMLRARESERQNDRDGLDELLARLEREGLVEPARKRLRLHSIVPLAAAASLAGAAVLGTFLWLGPTTDPLLNDVPRLRGFGVEVLVRGPELEQWVRQTAQALERAGCPYTRLEEGPMTLVVDASQPCVETLNERLAGRAPLITEPGRYRITVGDP